MIVAFYELDASRGGSFDEEFVREYDRHYIAVSDSRLDAEPEIWAHPKCPVPRSTTGSWDNLARCVAVDAKFRKGTRYRWDVTAKFSSAQNAPAKTENPLDEPAKIEFNSELITVERYTDRQGRPIVNRAGSLIKTKIEIPQVVISIQKNIAVFNSWITDINGIINNSPVRIRGKLFPTGNLKVTKVQIGDIEYKNDIPYMVAKLEMRVDNDGWIVPVLNQGYYELIEDQKKTKNGSRVMIPVRCRTGVYGPNGCDGEPEAEPVFLDDKGQRPSEYFLENNVRKKRPKTILDPSDIVLLKFDVHTLYDFKRLPLA